MCCQTCYQRENPPLGLQTQTYGTHQRIMSCFQRYHHIPINTLSTNDIYETSSINIDNDLGIDNTRSIIELSCLS